MSALHLPTLHASAERLQTEHIKHQNASVLKIPLLQKVLDGIPEFALLLNTQRQIVFANQAFMSFVGERAPNCPLGLKPGEALNCIHSDTMEGGCGTSEFCQECGAVNAIINSQKGKDDCQECRITRKTGEALDLKVWTSQIEYEGNFYTFFYVSDKGDEKRRRVLERLFFHDIMNTVGGLYGFADLLRESLSEDDSLNIYAKTIFDLSRNLIEEIQTQKDIMAAENNELVVKAKEINSMELLNDILEVYTHHDSARGKSILISQESCSINFKCDRNLLFRVISNMLKNALEASKVGETAALACEIQKDNVVFSVHNPGYIPRKVQLQIFNRSFSTKGAGRGLGTYSIKLFGEKYLKGRVSFKSSEDEGTIFKIAIPLLNKQEIA